MSKLPWKKNLYLCLPTFKCLPLITQDHPQPSDDVDPLMITTNNTYHHQDSNSSNQSTSKSEDFFSSSSDSEAATDSTPDFATVLASRRFFFASPGRSNSIVETHNTEPYKFEVSNVARGVTVAKFSSNPYLDFRKSMEDMLEARDHVIDNKNGDDIDVAGLLKSDLDYLHELLLCYLQLNPRDAHKDIVNAFTDLVICILSAIPAHSTSASSDVDDHHMLDEKEETQLQLPTSLMMFK